MRELIGQYDYGLKYRLYEIVTDLVASKRLAANPRPRFVYDISQVRTLPPLMPGKMLNAAVNFYSHVNEGGTPEEQKKAAAHPEWKGATVGEDMIEMPWVDKAHVFTVELPMQQDRIEVDLIKKIHRILGKQVPGAPHEVFLVLDATNGQNAIAQAENFTKAVKCSGIILAKLDGTAKGGAIFTIKKKLGLPVKFIGVGEKLEDMEVFDPESYVAALFEN